jgi:hypothetical protein
MTMKKKKNEIHVEHMEGSSLAAGDEATAIVGSQVNRSEISEARDEMRSLIALIQAHQREVPEAERVQQSIIEARKELKRKKPDLEFVRRVFIWVAATVSGVDTLADAVTKVQALIAHL